MRKKTIRKMTALARELARINNQLYSMRRRLKTIIGKVQTEEMWAKAGRMNPTKK